MAEKMGEKPSGTCSACGMELHNGVCSGCGMPPAQCKCKK
jgi:hypothetical protein